MSHDITPFRPRATTFRDVWRVGNWRLKRYAIVYDGGPADWAEYDDVWPRVEATLPQPAVGRGRPGVGFVIAHRGASLHYLILAWWDRENEVPLRVFVKGFGSEDSWRAAEGSESVCVWDLEIIWFERCAYVETLMGEGDSDADSYLERQFVPTT